MKTIFINDVEFELVPVVATITTGPIFRGCNPYVEYKPGDNIAGYMLRPIPPKEPVNSKKVK